MNIIPNFEHDVFINYAHIDNRPFEIKGWIDLLYERLLTRLSNLLGREVSFWRDVKLQGNDVFADTQILHISKVAIFIPVISPRYVMSAWCIKELQEFCRRAAEIENSPFNFESRIFKVVKTHTPNDEQPRELQSLPSYNFYSFDQESGQPREFNFGANSKPDEQYLNELDHLAWDVKECILRLENYQSTSVEPIVVPSRPPTDYIKPNQSESARLLRVFLCHSSSDKPAVRALYHRLRADKTDPWLDEEDILPGQDWQREIPKAVSRSDVVVVCLSKGSSNRSGYLQKEIKYALDVADEKPEDTIYIIPLRLEECDVPDRLRRWQWVNIFEERGYDKLMRTLKACALTIDATSNPISQG